LEVAIVAFERMLAYEHGSVQIEEKAEVAEPEAVVPV